MSSVEFFSLFDATERKLKRTNQNKSSVSDRADSCALLPVLVRAEKRFVASGFLKRKTRGRKLCLEDYDLNRAGSLARTCTVLDLSILTYIMLKVALIGASTHISLAAARLTAGSFSYSLSSSVVFKGRAASLPVFVTI